MPDDMFDELLDVISNRMKNSGDPVAKKMMEAADTAGRMLVSEIASLEVTDEDRAQIYWGSTEVLEYSLKTARRIGTENTIRSMEVAMHSLMVLVEERNKRGL